VPSKKGVIADKLMLFVRYILQRTSYHQPKHFYKHFHYFSRVTITSLYKLLNLVTWGSILNLRNVAFNTIVVY